MILETPWIVSLDASGNAISGWTFLLWLRRTPIQNMKWSGVVHAWPTAPTWILQNIASPLANAKETYPDHGIWVRCNQSKKVQIAFPLASRLSADYSRCYWNPGCGINEGSKKSGEFVANECRYIRCTYDYIRYLHLSSTCTRNVGYLHQRCQARYQ